MRKLNIYNLYTSFGQQKTGVEYGPYYLRDLGLLNTIKENGYELNNSYDIFGHYYPSKWQSISEMTNQLKGHFTQKKEADLELFIGGDHSMSFSSLSTLNVDKESVVIWLDAHPDMNTMGTSSTGNIHGMPLAYAMGYGEEEKNSQLFKETLDPDNVFLVGIRSIDREEANLIKAAKVHAYPSSYIKKNSGWLEECVDQIAARNSQVHLSFDIDSLDKALVPGTGTPIEDGLSVEQVLEFIRQLKKRVQITSVDLVEVNPYLDNQKDSRTGHYALKVLNEILA